MPSTNTDSTSNVSTALEVVQNNRQPLAVLDATGPTELIDKISVSAHKIVIIAIRAEKRIKQGKYQLTEKILRELSKEVSIFQQGIAVATWQTANLAKQEAELASENAKATVPDDEE